MQCNIDRAGRIARATTGALCLLTGVAFFAGWIGVTGGWRWIGGGLLLAAGAFQEFEAAAGWCIMRAMGYRTPM